jgi:uncharacterized membrane protein YdjX (TVP38/TMEM64 family)
MKPSKRVIPSRALVLLIFVGGFLALFLLGQVLACGLAAGAPWCRWWPHFSLESIQDLVRSAGPWAAVASIGLMILHSFVPFPSEFIAVANGMVFGFAKGVAVTWIGAMAGAVLAFGLVRFLGRPLVLKKLSEKQEHRLEEWMDLRGTDALLIGRLIPAISFNLMNYGAGLSPVSWWTFLWTTGLGILPLTILMVGAGERIDEIPLWAWALLVLAAFFFVGIVHGFKILRRKKESGEG